MTRDQIIANAKKGAQKAAQKGFASALPKSKHTSRLLQLKERTEADKKHNEEMMVVARRA